MRNSPWLGQVPLVSRPGGTFMRFSIGTKETPSWQKQPPGDALPPEGAFACVYLGGRSFLNPNVDQNIKEAKANGYTEIHEVPVPPCVGERCFISSGTPTKYVWACRVRGAETPIAPPIAEPAPRGEVAPAPEEPKKNTALLVGGGLATAGLIAFLALR